MRHAYLQAMERERAAWRHFMLANACAASSLKAHEGWRAAARQLEAVAQQLEEAGIEPPQRFFLPSTSLARSGERG